MSTHKPQLLGAILRLAASQVEVALQTAESEVAALSDAVATIVELVAQLPESQGETVGAIHHQARQAMVAMQYHDQVTQRLAHVRDALTDVYRANEESMDDVSWGQLMSTIRARFSMEDERLLFDKIMAWEPPESATRQVVVTDAGRGCVELF